MFKSLASRRSDKAIMTRIFTDQLSLGQMYLNKVFKILISDMSNFFDDVDCSLNMTLLWWNDLQENLFMLNLDSLDIFEVVMEYDFTGLFEKIFLVNSLGLRNTLFPIRFLFNPWKMSLLLFKNIFGNVCFWLLSNWIIIL